MAIKDSLVCMGLVAAGAACTAAGSPEAAIASTSALSLIGGLMSNAAGNFAADAMNRGGDKLAGLFANKFPDIDENHHILIALRKAHLEALSAVLKDFDEAREARGPAANSAEEKRFAKQMAAFLKQAHKDLKAPASSPNQWETEVFQGLPQAFQDGMAARNSASGDDEQSQLKATRKQINDAVLAELLIGTATTQTEVPPLFIQIFTSEEPQGWLDRFLRASAAQFKSNEPFKAIWTGEQLSLIASTVQDLKKEIKDLRGDMKAGFESAEEAAERRHQEMLQAIARDKGVPIEKLQPILERLGHNNVRENEMACVLASAVDHLLEQSKRETIIHNDAPSIDQAIQRARAKLQKLDVTGAISDLDAAIAEEEAEEARRQKARARLFFEKADILTGTYDHEGAIKAREKGLELDESEIWGWIELGNSYRTLGNSKNALLQYKKGLEQAERQGDVREQAACLSFIGDVHVAQGDLPAALEAFEKVLKITEHVVRSDPGNAEWQRDLSVSQTKLGDVYVAQGNLLAALEAFQKGLEIREHLVQSDPGNAEWQRDPAVSQNKLGNIYVAQGNLPAALEAFEKGLEIVEHLAQTDPGKAELQRDLSVFQEKLGNVYVAQGNLPAALKFFEKSLKIDEYLVQSDPGNTEWQRDLIVSHVKLSEVSPDDAKFHLEKALAIATELKQSKRLVPVDDWMIQELKKRLAALSKPDDT